MARTKRTPKMPCLWFRDTDTESFVGDDDGMPKPPATAPESVMKVFTTIELLGIIMCFAIFNKNQFDRQTARSLRLVNKAWKVELSRQLTPKKACLYTITLRETYLRDRVLTRFTSQFPNSNSFTERISMKIEESYFRMERYHKLHQFLVAYAASIFELVIFIPNSGGNVRSSLFTGYRLINLSKLYVKFDRALTLVGSQSETNRAISLLKSFFDSATSKTDTQFRITSPELVCTAPITVQPLNRFPKCISNLIVECAVRENDLKRAFIRDNFTKLQSLELKINTNVNTKSFYRVMDKLSGTLRSLKLTVEEVAGKTLTLDFPKMKCLKKLSIDYPYYKFRTGLNPDEVFPKLDSLAIVRQRCNNITSLMSQAAWEKIKTLKVQFVDEKLLTVLGTGHVEDIYAVFTNLTSLTIQLQDVECGVYKTIFKQLKRLKTLNISMFSVQRYIQPCHIATQLLQCDEFKVALNHHNRQHLKRLPPIKRNQPSITSLRDLEHFGLWTEGPQNKKVKISEILFTVAFFKMQKLRSLEFGGVFIPGKRMERKWRVQGKMITYKTNHTAFP